MQGEGIFKNFSSLNLYQPSSQCTWDSLDEGCDVVLTWETFFCYQPVIRFWSIRISHQEIWADRPQDPNSILCKPSQPQRITSRLKTMFNLSPIYSARKSSNHKLSINHKISQDTNLHKTKHTQTSDTKLSKKESLRYHPCWNST